MKKWLTGFVGLWMVLAYGQILKPYTLGTEVKEVGPGTYDLIITGTLEKGWHLYTPSTDPDGSSPMTVQWHGAGKDYELVGKPKEIGAHQAYNDIFGVTETFWSDKVRLVQRVKVKNPSLRKITATVDAQVCKEACILVNEDLTFDLPAASGNAATSAQTSGTATADKTGKKFTRKETGIQSIPSSVNENASKTETSVSGDSLQMKDERNAGAEESSAAVQVAGGQNATPAGGKTSEVKQKVVIEEHGKKSLWWIFFMSVLGGLLALLMPCIYPMIPLTISFFTKQSEQNPARGKVNAVLYGLFIVGIFVFFSIPFHFLDSIDPNIFNKIATDPWLNLLFFVIFFIFALSFLGVSKLDPQRLIPSKWISKSDEYSQKTGGLIAIFFMALTLILVSFSCTGPILGALLGSVAFGGATALTVGMLGFGIGLGLPFTLFALFPSMLKSMPQSGGWLNTLKVSLGFIELALAFKFLSNTDLVLQLHLLEREVFLAIWIAIFLALSMYLFGLFRTPYDAPVENLSVTRLLFAMLFLAFSIYMFPGLWGAPLKWISAFPPYQEYSESPHGVGYRKNISFTGGTHATAGHGAVPEGAKILHEGLTVFNDYEQGLTYARKVNKPVMLDFTGFACVNCRKMENNVWTDPQVHRILKDSLIIISLYVDDKRPLPESEQYISKYSGKKIRLAGDKWAELQIYEYKSNSQPYYVLLSPGGEVLNQPIAYTDKDTYLKWLREGLRNLK